MLNTVVELFAGVGGFRVGMNSVTLNTEGKVNESNKFKFVWTNQFEPSSKIQHAFDCYQTRFGISKNHSNQDIAEVDKNSIPDHSVLVGGFPCQDYSVARSLSQEKGIEGKKGVLWWQIDEIVKVKKPPFILLENVDRLLKSPSKQRGRDFGIMLRCLHDSGYDVEWRVINAADYGFAQKRKRIFIFAYHSTTNYFKNMTNLSAENILGESGIFSKQFKVSKLDGLIEKTNLDVSNFKDLIHISDKFSFNFENSGVIKSGQVYTTKTNPIKVEPVSLGDILVREEVDLQYFNINEEKYKYLKSSKRIERTDANGFKYTYSEGAMSFPDRLDLPGRTMLTSEGTLNRSTHIVEDFISQKNRILTPVEAERLNGFPDNWTNTGLTDRKRYFMMGNALVCGIVEKLANELSLIIQREK